VVPLHEHDGAEFIYVISGALDLSHDERSYQLSAGDSVYFNSSVPHGYNRRGQETCTAVVITAPSAE
jgi:quercetin dioxygenase-like cupin family protein